MGTGRRKAKETFSSYFIKQQVQDKQKNDREMMTLVTGNLSAMQKTVIEYVEIIKLFCIQHKPETNVKPKPNERRSYKNKG